MTKSGLSPVWDGTLLIVTALAFWGVLFLAWMYKIDREWVSLGMSSLWVFGITVGLFKHLWRRAWLWLVLGAAFLAHVTLHGFLSWATPFDYGMNTVVFNLELGALVVVVSELASRLHGRRSRTKILQRPRLKDARR